MGETLKKSAKSDVVENKPEKVMTPEKLGVISRMFGAKKKKKKGKNVQGGDPYKAAWDAAVNAVELKIGLVPKVPPFDADRDKLEKTMEKIREKRVPGKSVPSEISDALAKVGARADTLKADWDSYCQTLLADKMTRVTRAMEELDADADRFAKAADRANMVVRDHGKDDREDLVDEKTRIATAQASRVIEISRLNAGTDFTDPRVDLATFTARVDAVVTSFQATVATAITTVGDIAKRPGRPQSDRDDFLHVKMPMIGKDDPFGTKLVLDVHDIRAAEVTVEQKRLANAVAAMTARMEELKLLRAGHDPQTAHDTLTQTLTGEIDTLAAEKKAAKRQLDRVVRYAAPVQKEDDDAGDDAGDDTAAPHKKKSKPSPEVLQFRKEAKAIAAKGTDAVNQEVARLQLIIDTAEAGIAAKSAQIDKMNDELAILKRDHDVNMSAAGKKVLEDEYNILKDQIEVIKAREKAFKAFKDGENARIDAMIGIREQREAQTVEVAALVDAARGPNIDIDDPAFAFLSDVTLRDDSNLGLDPEIDRLKNAKSPGDALIEANKMLTAEVARVHATVDRGQRVTPTEPEITRISKAEFDMLSNLLTNVAKKLIENQEFEIASKVHMKVRSLLVEFQNDTARQTAVAPAAPAVPDREKDLVRRLNQLEVPIMALAAKGLIRADAMEKARTDLIDAIKAEAAKAPPDWNAIERQVEKMEADVANPALPGPSSELLDARKKAGKARDEINQQLASIYNTDKMTPEEIARIDEPGKAWPKDAQGKTTKPEAKDLILPEDVLWVVENGQKVAYRIDTKETGGKDITRRGKGHHHVPREMMALIRSDAEVLDLMGESEVEDMAAIADEFIKTAKARLDAVTAKDADKTYKEVEDTIDKITDIVAKNPFFGHNTLLRMHPEGLAGAKKEFEAFKKDWPRMLPDDAKTTVTALYDQFKALQKSGADLEKTYEAAKKSANARLKEFENGLVVADNISFVADDLIAKAGPALSDDDKEALQTVADQMLDVWDYRGAWMEEVKAAHRLIKEKSSTAVKEGTEKLNKTKAEIATFKDDYNRIMKLMSKDTLSRGEQEIVADFARKATRVVDSAVEGKRKHEEGKAAYDALFAKLEEGIDEAKKLISGKSQKEILEQRRDAIKKQRDAMKAEVKDFEDYEWANRECSELKADIDQLIKDAKADVAKSADLTKKPIAAKRATSVDKWLKQLQSEILRLDAAYLSERADDTQKIDMAAAFNAVEASMKQAVKALGDATNLIVQCTQIDDMMADRNDKYDNKLRRREAAMAECRRIRFALDENPALELFRQNPFPDLKPTALMMLMGSLHSCEIAILNSVDPNTAKKTA